MTTNTGGYSMDDLRAARFQKIVEMDTTKINETLQADLANWEAQVQENLSLFCQTTTERQMVFGSSATIGMEELDEYGRPSTKKVLTGSSVAFPLSRFASAVGYTDLWLKSHSPAEMVEKQLMVQRGHNERILKEIKKAIYFKDNYTFVDHLVDNVSLACKRWINADGSLLPDAPDGTKFAGTTHTYFMNRAGGALAASDIDLLAENVSHHGFDGLVLIISNSDSATVSALTGFTPLSAPTIQYNATDSTIQRLDITADPSNRMIGYWGDNFIPVYTKPYALANYILCMALNAPEKPLARRIHEVPALQGLRLEAKFDAYPLIADNYVALEGYAVLNRLAGAVLMNAAAYTDPTID